LQLIILFTLDEPRAEVQLPSGASPQLVNKGRSFNLNIIGGLLWIYWIRSRKTKHTHINALACWLINNYLFLVQLIICKLWWCQEGYPTLMFHCHIAIILEVSQTLVACTSLNELDFGIHRENWLISWNGCDDESMMMMTK
jgi:hypothetical protein